MTDELVSVWQLNQFFKHGKLMYGRTIAIGGPANVTTKSMTKAYYSSILSRIERMAVRYRITFDEANFRNITYVESCCRGQTVFETTV